MTLDEILNTWIPYRLQALETLQFAWSWSGESDSPRKVQVLEGERVRLEGNVAAIANPMIESGIIHARALLEFLGLAASKGRLVQAKNRREDDFAVEHFSTPTEPLSTVSPEEALSAYEGPPEEAEAALVAIFEWANKGLAHLTSGALSQAYTESHLDIACRGIPVLLHNHLYAKLGRTVPPAPTAYPAAMAPKGK